MLFTIREGSTLLMSYEQKIAALADTLEQFVFADIHSVEQAKRYATCNTTSVSQRSFDQDGDCRHIQHLVESFIEDPSRYGIQLLLPGIGTNIGTKHSAVREAITLCATRYTEQANRALLGMAIA